jgi:hypothetical protein
MLFNKVQSETTTSNDVKVRTFIITASKIWSCIAADFHITKIVWYIRREITRYSRFLRRDPRQGHSFPEWKALFSSSVVLTVAAAAIRFLPFTRPPSLFP